jgi:hypothetical protein
LNWKQFLASRKAELFTISALLIVSGISFGEFNSGILSSDDWSYFVTKYVFGTLHPINLTDRRPLVLVLYYGLASLFGLRFEYYYFFNFLILFSSALMVYVLVKRVFPEHTWIASLVALTYLIYPADYTRTWFIMIYIRFWWLVSLGVIWLLLEYAASGKLWIYALAMLGIAIPLGAYEGQFGIILLASALIAFFSNKAPLKRRLIILAGTIGIGFAFLLWRTYLQVSLFKINDTYVEALQFSPAILVERYLHGLYIFFIGWLDPILDQLKFMGVNIIPWVLVYIAICAATLVWISSRTSTFSGSRNGWKRPENREAHQKISLAKSYFIIFLVGSALWVAGYIPIIALYRPALAIVSSRINTFAVPGAALMFVSGIAIIATFITNSSFTQRLTMTAIVLPFIIAGIFVQLQVNQENQIKWETQKRIWNKVFATIPNIQDKSRIVIIIPGYQQLRPFESFPFLSGWEIEAGAQVLYNNPNISGNYYYKDIQAPELLFTKNGFRQIPTDKIFPYKKLIFVFYDPQVNSVTLVKNLEDTLALPFSVNNYNPLENIISAEPSTVEFRWLVE